MVEVLAAIGLGAKELFNYNRENYKFDQDQRLEREQLRLEMQVKRFELFREDVRDLVELTVGRMDVYHLVGALFLEFCVSFFCEGRIQASAPPFILSLFLLSNACAFVYLLLAVWLSMHASIASHSFGVRLLTRFVRLPIPSPQQISSLSSQLADFEAQGVGNVLRLPVFAAVPSWRSPTETGGGPARSEGENDLAQAGAHNPAAPDSGRPHPASTAARGSGSATATQPGISDSGEVASQTVTERQNLLGKGETPFSGEDMLLRPAATTPGLHVQLFRRLQAKWQCYDAYCRICMALGVNQILQGLSYYSIVHTLVENRSPSCGYALVFIFQSMAVALMVLDVAGLRRRTLLAVQAVGMLPALLAAAAVHSAARTDKGALVPHEEYRTSPAMFLLQACWLEMLLWVAAPSADSASLPRRFRSVLFLDVFGDAGDPTEAELQPPPAPSLSHARRRPWGSEEEQVLAAERVASAELALALAQAAQQRWEAAPRACLSEEQCEELARMRLELQIWQRALASELAWRAAARGLPHATSMWDEGQPPWGELTSTERADEHFAGFLLGPFDHDTGYEMAVYYYDPERVRCVWDMQPQRPVLSLAAVSSAIRGLEAAVRLLLAMAEAENQGSAEDRHSATLAETPETAGGLLAAAGAACQAVQRFQRHLFRRTAGIRDLQPPEPLDLPLIERSESPHGRAPRVPLHGVDHRNLIAGPHARHFVPERLPWQVLRGVTRVLQLAWGFTGTMAVLRELGIYRIDFQQHPGKGERRLSPAVDRADSARGAQWHFAGVETMWPHGSFFQPEGLSCLSGVAGGLLVGSPFGQYQVRNLEQLPFVLEEVPDVVHPPGTAALCSEQGECIVGGLQDDSIELAVPQAAHADEKIPKMVRLHVVGRPWQLLAGASVRCGGGSRMASSSAWGAALRRIWSGSGSSEEWCLLLVGWDGLRLPVALLPLPDGPSHLPSETSSIQPRFSAPLVSSRTDSCSPSSSPESCQSRGGQSKPLEQIGHCSQTQHNMVALHVSPERGRLWGVLANGELRSWDLIGLKYLGRLHPQWPSHFQPAAVCEDRGQSLYGVGSNEVGEPVLVRAELHREFPLDSAGMEFSDSENGSLK